MRKLTEDEFILIHGANTGTFTVSAESVGTIIGGAAGSPWGTPGAVVGSLIGGATANYLQGQRRPGSTGPSGIPWGGPMWGPSSGSGSNQAA